MVHQIRDLISSRINEENNVQKCIHPHSWACRVSKKGILIKALWVVGNIFGHYRDCYSFKETSKAKQIHCVMPSTMPEEGGAWHSRHSHAPPPLILP